MKQIQTVSSAAAFIMLVLFSCNSGDTKSTSTTSTDSTTTDSTTKMSPAPAAPAAAAMTLLIKQKVASFTKWMPAYEGHDSARLAYGLHNFVISRGIKDSNEVMVALHVDDSAKAMQFAASPGLKEAMKKGGIIGTPTFKYTLNRFHDSTTDGSTDRVILDFKVKSYDTWKKSFDGDHQQRMDAGMADRAISEVNGNPNEVSLVIAISDMKKAEDFMHSKELKHRMDSAGVIGAPDIFIYHVVKQY